MRRWRYSPPDRDTIRLPSRSPVIIRVRSPYPSPTRIVMRAPSPPQAQELPLLRALSSHLSNLVSDERIKRTPNDFAGITTLTNELLPEITQLTQAITALSLKLNSIGEKRGS